jgi:hypothetical protein
MHASQCTGNCRHLPYLLQSCLSLGGCCCVGRFSLGFCEMTRDLASARCRGLNDWLLEPVMFLFAVHCVSRHNHVIRKWVRVVIGSSCMNRILGQIPEPGGVGFPPFYCSDGDEFWTVTTSGSAMSGLLFMGLAPRVLGYDRRGYCLSDILPLWIRQYELKSRIFGSSAERSAPEISFQRYVRHRIGLLLPVNCCMFGMYALFCVARTVEVKLIFSNCFSS